MDIEGLIRKAAAIGASDVHLEPGLPVVFRVAGELTRQGSLADGTELAADLRRIAGDAVWEAFRARHSADAAATIGGVRCRISLLRSRRGTGAAIRLLATRPPGFSMLNLHPDVEQLARLEYGLVILAGPTGAGKSTTLAAIINSIAESLPRHVVTIEEPIEYVFEQGRALVRQREVGTDVPSFARGLRDALREDPDVIVVGEMRDAETIQLVLDAAEAGHLVMTTLHAGSVVESLQRIVAAFPAEIHAGVALRLAQVLQFAVCQRIVTLPGRVRAPELEVLRATTPARSVIRGNEFTRLASVLETGGAEGQWTRARYRRWLEAKSVWASGPVEAARGGREPGPESAAASDSSAPPVVSRPEPRQHPTDAGPDDVIVIDPGGATSLSEILSELDDADPRDRRRTSE